MPRTDATWGAPGTAELDPDTASRPTVRLLDEVCGDIAQMREERELRRAARRAERDEPGK